MKVFLAAGHGGNDPGATRSGCLSEAQVVTTLRDSIAAELAERGIAVEIDGRPGENLPFRLSIALANGAEADIRIEYHMNAGPARATGTETFCMPKWDALARSLSEASAQILGIPLRGDRGVKRQEESPRKTLGWLTQADGVLHETAFLSNGADYGAVLNKMDELAAAHANAIVAFLHATQKPAA